MIKLKYLSKELLVNLEQVIKVELFKFGEKTGRVVLFTTDGGETEIFKGDYKQCKKIYDAIYWSILETEWKKETIVRSIEVRRDESRND